MSRVIGAMMVSLALLLAWGCADGTQRRGPVLPSDADWGIPPQEDWVAEVPKDGASGFQLPPFEGWYRHLGVNKTASSLAVGPNVVALQVEEELQVLSLETGNVLWTYPLPDWFGNALLLVDDEHVYAAIDERFIAFDARTGRKVWQRSNLIPVAYGEGLVWAFGSFKAGQYESPALRDVHLLRKGTGEDIKIFSTDDIRGSTTMVSHGLAYAGAFAPTISYGRTFAQDSSAGTDLLAIKTAQNIDVFYADGRSQSFESALPYWPAGMALTKQGLVVTEFQAVVLEGIPEKLSEEFYESEGAHLVVRLIDLNSGKTQWKKEFQSNEYSGWGSRVESWGDYVVIAKSPGLLVLNLANGDAVLETPWTNMRGGADESFALGDGLIYMPSESSMGEVDGLAVAPVSNPDDSRNLAFDLAIQRYALGENVLVVEAESYPAGHFFHGRNGHLLVIRLGEDGQLVAGKLSILNVPESLDPLVRRFLKSKDPVKDSELMREFVAHGVNGLSALLENIQEATPRQLDAMVAFALYLDKRRGRESYAQPASQILVYRFLDEASEKLGKRVALWLKDESTYEIHPYLLGVLAKCGGQAAKKELDAIYGAKLLARMSMPEPPYRIAKPERPPGRHERDTETAEDVWSEVVTPDGKRYVAYTSPGLVSARDIYLGVDEDNDGAFEEVLPTGLTDTFFYNIHPSGVGGVDRKGPLRLEVTDDSLSVVHHQPVVEKSVEEYDGHAYEREEMVDARYITTRLSLEELRLDTDGDGFTDIAERLLFTDPASADTDGDGVSDPVDATPNVNAASMNREERGVQRSLVYFFQRDSRGGFWWRRGVESHPYDALYLRIDGCGEVAFSPSETTYGVSLASEDSRESYDSLLSRYNADSAVSVRLIGVSDFIRGDYGEMMDDLSAMTDTAMEEFMDLFPWKDAEYIVTLEFSTVGYMIPLVDVERELFPIIVEQTWIS